MKTGKLSFCDAEMINKIESFQEQAEEENKTDPRWDILKNIKNN